MCTRLDRRIAIGQRVDEDMQMTRKDMEHNGQEVERSEEPKGPGTYSICPSVVESSSCPSDFWPRLNPLIAPIWKRGTGLGGAVFRPALSAALPVRCVIGRPRPA